MILLEPTSYPKGTPRSMVHWSKLVNTLYTNADMHMQRYLLADLNATPSITFIRSLLDRISEPYFLNTEDEFDLYRQYVLPEAITISRIIDPLSGANYKGHPFVKGKDTREITLPTWGLISPTANSIYSDWEDWEDVAPIKILSHDSDELHLKFHNGEIVFKKDKPSQMVFGIDIPALLWKYILYIKKENLTFETVDRDLFVSKYILPYFYKDLVDIWLMRVINNRFDAYEAIDDEFAMPVSNNSFVGASTVKSAVNELDDIIQMLDSKKVSFGTFLNTPLIGDTTLMDCITIYGEAYAMENSPRYTGYELIKSVDLMSILLGGINTQLKFNTSTKIIRDLKVTRNVIARSRWESHIVDRDLGYKAANLLDMIDTTLIIA
jgi:hypothetical protein